MNPGESVASPRSITCAPLGIGRLLPASVMVLPWTMTTPFVTSAFALPSKSRAAFRTVTLFGASAAKAMVSDRTRKAQPIMTRCDQEKTD